MRSSLRGSRVGWVLGLAIASGGGGVACVDRAALEGAEHGAALAREGAGNAAAPAPEGYLLAVNGTHVERCVGSKCPTMWSDSPGLSPNNCGIGIEPRESYIVHQRGADWDGIPGEPELHGNEYRFTQGFTAYPLPGIEPPGTVRTMHNQSAIVQCCPSVAGGPVTLLAIKVCPDPCDAPDGQCPITMSNGENTQTFGKCKATSGSPFATDRCDLLVVEAGWNDPHAPHDLTHPSGEDKRVFNLYYRAAWTCGDGFCDVDEDESCGDCSAP